MYDIKGFIKIAALANNTPNNTSVLGELSNASSTYSTEKGKYVSANSQNVQLETYHSVKDDVAVATPAALYTHILEVAQWLYIKSVSGAVTDDQETCRSLLLAQYPNTIVDLEVGEMMNAKSNWLPAYMTWTFVDADLGENTIRVWFADLAFATQYDEYEHTVISMITDLDKFMETIKTVKPLVESFDLSSFDDRVQELADDNPYTYRVTDKYTWHDREDDTAQLTTYWTVLIHGVAGKNPLLIKQAIADYILANSSYTKSEWAKVFPDIFTSTEFTIIPMWHMLSVADKTPAGQLYSPIVPYNVSLALGKKYSLYDISGHVESKLAFTSIQYKSMSALSCAGPENRTGINFINDAIEDYATLSTQSGDFDRMSPKATGFVRLLLAAVIAAESLDEYTYLDVELARVVKGDYTYVSFEYDNVLYMVLSRGSMTEVADLETTVEV